METPTPPESLSPRDNTGLLVLMRLPKDETMTTRLKAQRDEYKQRLADATGEKPFTHPDVAQDYGTRMKLFILDNLLVSEELSPYSLAVVFARDNPALIERYGLEVFGEEWSNAVGVINDYCETGGANLSKPLPPMVIATPEMPN